MLQNLGIPVGWAAAQCFFPHNNSREAARLTLVPTALQSLRSSQHISFFSNIWKPVPIYNVTPEKHLFLLSCTDIQEGRGLGYLESN